MVDAIDSTSRELMAPFRFELAAVESIAPWGAPGGPNLSWFALTLGDFWIDLGDVELFRYAPAALATWGVTKPYADYQIASFVRDLRSCVPPALSPLPAELERLAADVHALAALQASTRATADAIDTDEAADLHYTAWRWLGERSPWMSYLAHNPSFYFVRLGDEIEIGYDNRGHTLDGVAVWTAQIGAHRMPVASFAAAVTEVSAALLAAMGQRIDDLERGQARPQAPVDVAALREQHAAWEREFATALGPSPPDVPWDETLAALAALRAMA
jgi:diadenosine tetraphosphatase ApaH/serine/threonine PP2A family protein phosphatase